MSSPGDQGKILLFIPAYNCEAQIGRVVAQLTPEVCALLSEVIVVDNCSTDGTAEAAISALSNIQSVPTRLLRNVNNYGLGGSHKVAFEYARANQFDYCIVLHGDDQGSIADLAPLLERDAHKNLDCLLGARFMPGSRLSGYSPLRTFGNHVFNALYSLAAARRIYDLGSGLNLYAVKALDPTLYLPCADDLTFNYHMLLRSMAKGWRIQFFPLEWREADQRSNVKLVRHATRVLSIVVDYAFNRTSYWRRDYSQQNGRYPSMPILIEPQMARATP